MVGENGDPMPEHWQYQAEPRPVPTIPPTIPPTIELGEN